MRFPCKSTGILDVTHGPPKIQVIVDPQIVEYARALVPPGVVLNRTRYAPHITVLRTEKVDPELWATAVRWHGSELVFSYDPRVVVGTVYWWLRAWSDDLVEIRRSFGLPDLWETSRPPDGEECFHATVGNLKGRV